MKNFVTKKYFYNNQFFCVIYVYNIYICYYIYVQLFYQQHKEQNLQKEHKQKLILALEQVLEDAGARWGSYVEIGDVDFDKLITAKALAFRLNKNEKDFYKNILD